LEKSSVILDNRKHRKLLS